ncbi:aspartate kinase [candidate division WOR-3 bacterium]|nr:aspartate kinase [candidate division WOR-3 bacterium]
MSRLHRLCGMRSINVYKIGGSVLQETRDYEKIAAILLRGNKMKICVVVSAMKGKTTELIDAFLTVCPKPDFWEFERFAGMGEVMSAQMFAAAFNALGAKSIAILPWMKEWPLFISLKIPRVLSREKINEKRDFKVMRKSTGIIAKYIMPLYASHRVIVFPGFIARDVSGRIVTLGRGGSDISALLFSELLRARELVLIKETGGVLDLDPRLHGQATKISSLDVEELGLLASSGSQVLHPVSLKHQDTLPRIKVTALDDNIHRRSGTEIVFKKKVVVQRSPLVYAVLTFIGNRIPETPGLLKKISSVLAAENISIYSITVSENLIALYIDQRYCKIAYTVLSPLVKREQRLKLLNLKKGIGKILVRSLKFINEPGIIKKIVTPIAKQGINIWEVLTAHTDVMVFVEHQDIEQTFAILQQVFKSPKSSP